MRMTRKTMQRFRRVAVAITVGVLLAFTGFTWQAANGLVSPPRRELQKYHAEWLDHPETHGIRIQP